MEEAQVTYYQRRGDWRLESVGDLVRILGDAATPRPNGPDRITQALLSPMPVTIHVRGLLGEAPSDASRMALPPGAPSIGGGRSVGISV